MYYWILKKKFLETLLLVVHFSYTVLFYRKKTEKMYDTFLLFKVIAREHVDTQGMLARKHMSK